MTAEEAKKGSTHTLSPKTQLRDKRSRDSPPRNSSLDQLWIWRRGEGRCGAEAAGAAREGTEGGAAARRNQ